MLDCLLMIEMSRELEKPLPAGSNIVPLSRELAQKAVQAAIAAIEVYNKPDFHFREEAFSLLITNAWELLLKAKWIADHGEDQESIYEYDIPAPGTRSLRL